MKYIGRRLALLLVFVIVLPMIPVRAENFLGNGENMIYNEIPPEEDKDSVSGDTVSSPDRIEKEQKKLMAVKKDVVEMAASGMDGLQPYATEDIASGTDGNINWAIDGSGKLTVTGTGDFTRGCPWSDYREKIIFAEVSVTGMTDASEMFVNCSNLSSLDVSNFDTSTVTDMGSMFSGCSSLNSLDVSSFDTSNVTNMTGMFGYCSSLNSLDVSSFDTSNVTNMASMFSGCSNLNSLNVSSFDTSNVTNMVCMFENCSGLTHLDVSSFDTSGVTNMWMMFADCSSLNSLDVSALDTSNVTNMEEMFTHCSSLSSLDVSSFDTSNVTTMRRMFWHCSSLSNLDLGGFVTSNVTNMTVMFGDCGSLISLDLSAFDTSSVTDMSSMFSGCGSLSSLDVSSFDTSTVTGMGFMFSGCSNLRSLELSEFDTSVVTNMSYMFDGCSSLLSLDLGNFDSSHVWYMDYMFSGCSSLTSLDLSNFNLSSVCYEMKDLLTGCASLETVRTPYGMSDSMSSAILPIPLPVSSEDFVWLMPDGSEISALPCNLSQSILLIQYKNPRIITTTPDLNMSDVIRIKYVPYSFTVQTNNWDSDNIVTYSIEKGTLACGLQMYPATGEIYGMPLEAGEFPITVKATFSNPRYLPSYKDLTLTVLDNTDSNVWNASDPGYEVEQYVGTLVSGSCPVLTELTDQLFVSAGAYREFIDFWLNGEKLVEGKDYTKEEGSTRITIRSQTFKEKADKNGVNTIAAEFRVGGDTGNALKRTAQNFRIKEQTNGNSSNSGGSAGSKGNAQHTGNTAPVPALQATAVVRLSTPSGAPLAGMQLELHSTPMEAVTDSNGAAIFNGVEGGWHTLYVKDGNGTLLASKGFELLFGDRETMEGDRIMAKADEPFTLAIQMDGDKLTFIPVGETAAVQENKAPQAMQAQSVNTGDSGDTGVWLVLFISFGALLAVFYWKEKKTRISLNLDNE